MDEIFMYDMVMKLSGVIFRKATMENNFTKVYGRVFDMMMDESFMDEMNFLEIFGSVGG